jgi:hypothetical protein
VTFLSSQQSRLRGSSEKKSVQTPRTTFVAVTVSHLIQSSIIVAIDNQTSYRYEENSDSYEEDEKKEEVLSIEADASRTSGQRLV